MSKDIHIIGKIWLFFMGALATIGIVTNLLAASQGITYIISACACVAELVGVIFMLKGKGLIYLCIYAVGYVANAVLVAMASSTVTASWFTGFIIGVALNVGLTYLAVRKTLKK
ncbi:MAG: hypothetical protein Q4E69_05620 [Bacilli bacterium]|nr:hypothetical protein [Bacilli bacterium]